MKVIQNSASGEKPIKLSEKGELILTFINHNGATTSKIICEHFNDISRMTVYRNLKLLEQLDYITRNHGLIAMKEVERDFSTKLYIQNEQKGKIAKWVVENLIPNNSSIILESGTTAAFTLKYLVKKKPTVILSNGLETLRLAQTHLKETDVLGSGGFLHHSQFIGSEAIDFFNHHYADMVLISATSCSFEQGCMDINKLECEVKRAMLKNAEKSVLLIDSSKINKMSLTKFAEIKDINYLITDKGADPEFIQQVQAIGVECYVVD